MTINYQADYQAERGKKLFGLGVFCSDMVLSGSRRQVFLFSFL